MGDIGRRRQGPHHCVDGPLTIVLVLVPLRSGIETRGIGSRPRKERCSCSSPREERACGVCFLASDASARVLLEWCAFAAK